MWNFLYTNISQTYVIKHINTWLNTMDMFHSTMAPQNGSTLKTFFYLLPHSFFEKQIFNTPIWEYAILAGIAMIIWLLYIIFKKLSHSLLQHISSKQFMIAQLLFLLTTITLIKTSIPMWNPTYLAFMTPVLATARSLILLCLLYCCVNIIQQRIKLSKHSDKFTIHILPICSMIAKVIIVLIGLTQIMHNFGYKTEWFLRAVSFSTLGIGLAAQDTIKNLFGSLMIIMDQPFKIGDEIVAGKVHGKVEDIGLRATLVRTNEGSVLYIPNAKLIDSQIENFGKRTLRIFSLEIPLHCGIPLDILENFMQGLRQIAAAQPFVNPNKIVIYMDRIDAEGLVIIVNLYSNTAQVIQEQECKNTIMPLIIALAQQLNIHLGKL